eukprot:2903945-Prymnesium_polylepis.1
MPPRVYLRGASEHRGMHTAGFCTGRDCDAVPPHTFQIPLARPTHPRAVRRPTIPPRGKLVGDVRQDIREGGGSQRSTPPRLCPS